MSLVPELQRLLAGGPGALPDTLVVDVGAIVRWAFETDPDADIWPTFIDVAGRTHRRVAWIVTETTLPNAGTDIATLDRIQAELERAVGPADVLRSVEPMPALLAAVLAEQPEKVGVVSAGLDERPHELWLLADGLAAAMLDVASGRLWPRVSALEDSTATRKSFRASMRSSASRQMSRPSSARRSTTSRSCAKPRRAAWPSTLPRSRRA